MCLGLARNVDSSSHGSGCKHVTLTVSRPTGVGPTYSSFMTLQGLVRWGLWFLVFVYQLLLRLYPEFGRDKILAIAKSANVTCLQEQT